ncbi:MAG: choice-of-anchor M domain-containing protein, partial [Actinomycetaceae bacterium]|nr:choice-of-anchor M domain-containing protein [Actinomycetaceae bacterium]
MRRTLRVAIAGAIIAGSMMQPAFASPDFGKEIMYNAHVDSPKVYWQGSNFELRSDAAGESRLIDQTVNWLGRGYTTVGTQLFAMRAPESGDLGFMGVESGDKLFAAPAVNGRNNGPIWSGFGADTSIPVERFRDGKFNLELVGFSGPGRMEMLNYYEDTPIRRFISSHDPHVRQTWVEPGTHTHNQTLFTRPGRYELAYRATARDEQNRVVASAPQILTWQVGGPNPELATLRDVVASYNASPETGTEEFAPRFSVAPNTQRIQDGAELLSTLTFETGNEADAGAAVFYVDGFYLGEVPVTSGSAVWNELLGDQDLALQVVFVPAEGSPSPRWVSAPLQLSREVTSASTFELGEFPTPVTRDPAAPFTADEYTPSSTKVNMHLEASEDHALLSVVPEDENLWFKVVGGAFEKGSDYPMCDIEFISTPTSRTWDSGSWWECSGEGMDIRLNIITPTRVKFAGTNVEFPVDEPGTYSAHLNSDFGGGVEPGVVEPEPAGPEAPSDPSNPDTPVDPADPSNPGTPVDPSDPSNPADPADPSNPADGESPTTPSNPGASEDPADSSNNEDNPQEPASPEEATLAEQKVEISAGHIDIGPAEVGGALRMAVRDESRQHAKTAVLRRPEAVTLVLGENSKVTRSKRAFADADFDFLGPVGTRVYVSPMQQRNGIVWPGFSTEHVDRHKYSKGMTFEISAVKAPKGGKWWLFTHDAFNGLNLIASSDSPGKIEAPEPLHKHVYWAFSEPG